MYLVISIVFLCIFQPSETKYIEESRNKFGEKPGTEFFMTKCIEMRNCQNVTGKPIKSQKN